MKSELHPLVTLTFLVVDGPQVLPGAVGEGDYFGWRQGAAFEGAFVGEGAVMRVGVDWVNGVVVAFLAECLVSC